MTVGKPEGGDLSYEAHLITQLERFYADALELIAEQDGTAEELLDRFVELFPEVTR